jgi:hypothetical protein
MNDRYGTPLPATAIGLLLLLLHPGGRDGGRWRGDTQPGARVDDGDGLVRANRRGLMKLQLLLVVRVRAGRVRGGLWLEGLCQREGWRDLLRRLALVLERRGRRRARGHGRAVRGGRDGLDLSFRERVSTTVRRRSTGMCDCGMQCFYLRRLRSTGWGRTPCRRRGRSLCRPRTT